MERWIRLAMALFAATALALQAQNGKRGGKGRPGGGGGKGLLEQADANGDGKVDDAEAEQFAKDRAEKMKEQLATIVKKFDANGDGTLDADEIAKMRNQITERGGHDPTRFIKHFDKNGDFQLSQAEEDAAVQGFVARVRQAGQRGGQRGGKQQARQQPADPDTNGDCIVDEQEARVEAERRVEQVRKQLEALKKRQEKNPNAKLPPFLAQLDKDGNGELSGEEANAIVEQTMKQFEEQNALVLKIFDDNKDGLLDAMEQANAKKAFLYAAEMQKQNAERFRRARGGGQGGPGRPGGREGRAGRRQQKRGKQEE
jgi:Ca2+-binding EF-hand superfamily protein